MKLMKIPAGHKTLKNPVKNTQIFVKYLDKAPILLEDVDWQGKCL